MESRGLIKLLLFLALLFHLATAYDHEIPESPSFDPTNSTPEALPIEYTSSRFRQACLKTLPNECSCSSLWDSPCNCDESDLIAPPLNGTACDCSKMCQEVWQTKVPLSERMRHECHIPQVRKYSVKAFIASKGGDSASLIPKLKRLAEVMGPAIKVDIHYVLDSSSTGYYSPRGHSEVIGDMIGKCAMKQNPQAKVFLPFLVCMMQNVTLVPNNLFNCTRLHSVDYERVRNCVYAEGQTLLSNDMAAAEHYRVDNAPRVFLDDRYYNPGVDSTYESYEYAMCYVFSNPTRPFPWFIFFIMGAVVCLVLVVFFTIKRWSNASFLDTLQSLFLWNNPSGSVADDAIDTLLYLRAYGHEFPEDEFDEDEELEEAEEPPPPEPEPEVSREEERAERRRRRRERRRNRRQEREAARASRSEAESTPEAVASSSNDPYPSSSEPVVESHPAYYESSDDEDTLLPH